MAKRMDRSGTPASSGGLDRERGIDAASGSHRDAGRHLGEERDDDAPELQAQTDRSDHANAFMPDPEEGPAVIGDDLAENLAEDFLRAATTGGNADIETLDEVVTEEIGGPFIETSALDEFGDSRDSMNPDDAEVEPRPRAVHGLVDRAPDDED
jgi:hypothetical protein